MPVKDDFPHEARWSSVGLDCSYCKNENGPGNWPDVNRVLSCKLHNISLDIQLNKEGFKDGEWFCKSFENNGKANMKAVNHFANVKDQLSDDMLYGFYGKNGNLKEISFTQLKNRISRTVSH